MVVVVVVRLVVRMVVARMVVVVVATVLAPALACPAWCYWEWKGLFEGWGCKVPELPGSGAFPAGLPSRTGIPRADLTFLSATHFPGSPSFLLGKGQRVKHFQVPRPGAKVALFLLDGPEKISGAFPFSGLS